MEILQGKTDLFEILLLEIDSSDSDVQEIDIENLLDEGLPDDLRERKKMHNYEERSKMVLEGKYRACRKMQSHCFASFTH